MTKAELDTPRKVELTGAFIALAMIPPYFWLLHTRFSGLATLGIMIGLALIVFAWMLRRKNRPRRR